MQWAIRMDENDSQLVELLRKSNLQQHINMSGTSGTKYRTVSQALRLIRKNRY